MKLLRFKDNTYTWICRNGATDIQSKAEMIATGVWQYKIPKREIETAIIELNTKGNEIATFSDVYNIFIYSEKQKTPIGL